jgi:predicted aspartyl protease
MQHLCGLLAALLVAGCTTGGGFETATGCALERRGELALSLRHDIPLVQATVDGTEVTLILDTGAERTLLTDAAVARLGLPRDAAHVDRVVGIGPTSEAAEAEARRFGLGDVSLHDRPIVVGAFALAGSEADTPDGLLGIDLLSHYDIDLDLPGRRATLYRARACPAGAPPWPRGASMLVAAHGAHDHLLAPVTLDGQALQASIDSGSETTTVALRALPRLGVSAAALAHDPVLRVQGMSRSVTTVHVHRFASLEIGGLAFRQPYIPVSPLPAFLGDALLGADVLRQHRVWLSWASDRIWIEAEP